MSAVHRLLAATLAISILSPTLALAQDATPASPAPQAPASSPTTTPTDVVAFPVRPSDTVRVVVAGATDLSGEFRVDAEDGTIAIAQLGAIKVAGLSQADVNDRIIKAIKAKKLLKNPDVATYLVARKAREIVINGAVTTQGSRTVKDGTTLSEVLEGATPLQTADLSRVVITRDGQDILVNYKKFQAGEERGETVNPVLQDRDKIYVYSSVQSAGVVRVIGEVKDTTKTLTPINTGATAGQVIQQAGGLTEWANRDSMVLVRGNERIPLNYLDIQRGGEGADPVLRDGDLLLIPRVDRLKQFAVTGAVREGKTYNLVPGEPVTIADAVGKAGGFTDGARQDKVELYHKDAAGNVTKRTINMTKGTDAMTPIQDGDYVFVPFPKGRGGVDAFSAVGLLSGLSLIFQGFRR